MPRKTLKEIAWILNQKEHNMPTEKAMSLGKKIAQIANTFCTDFELLAAELINEEYTKPDIEVKAGQLWEHKGVGMSRLVMQKTKSFELFLVDDPRYGFIGWPDTSNFFGPGLVCELRCNWKYIGMFKDIIKDR